MADRPIIFSAPMVRALLDGRKTQTRRVLKPQPELNSAGLWRLPPFSQKITRRNWKGFCQTDDDGLRDFILTTRHRPYDIGQRLWVREAWAHDAPCAVQYRAGPHVADDAVGVRWRSPIHMPRWASRLTLIVTDVRVQRVQEISEADAVAEGIESDRYGAWRCYASEPKNQTNWADAVESYRTLWNSLHGQDAWDANPWVAAITFTVQQGNIDGGRADG